MVIYTFLKMFKSDSKKHVTLRSRQGDQNHTSVQQSLHTPTTSSTNRMSVSNTSRSQDAFSAALVASLATRAASLVASLTFCSSTLRSKLAVSGWPTLVLLCRGAYAGPWLGPQHFSNQPQHSNIPFPQWSAYWPIMCAHFLGLQGPSQHRLGDGPQL